MTDYIPISRFPLPEQLEPEGLMCVKLYIPNDPQYLSTLTGLLDVLTWSKSFARDETKEGAATVSRTWERALLAFPIESEACEVVETRINPETCLYEVNCGTPEDPDWKVIITPLTDPRTDIPYPVPYPDPPPEGQTNECLSASNIAEWVWFACEAWSTQLATGAVYTAFIVQVMSIIDAIFTLATDIVLDETVTMFAVIEPTTIDDDFAALDKQDFIDLIVCYLNSDGTFPSIMWGNFLSDLYELGTGNQAWYLVRYACILMGWGGVNITARMGGVTEAECAECEECEWTQVWNAENGWDGWYPLDSDPTYGVLSSGAWQSVTGGGYTNLIVNSPVVTGGDFVHRRSTWKYTVTGTTPGGGQHRYNIYGSFGVVGNWAVVDWTPGTKDQTIINTEDLQQIAFDLEVLDGTVTVELTEVRFCGDGSNPYT